MMLANLFRSSPPVPQDYRRNFLHLYLDMGWFGVLSGSSMAFLVIYAARLGASGFEIGMLGAMPAVMNMVFAIPSGRWLQRQKIDRAVFWTSVFYRFGYLFFIPLPWIFGPRGEIWALIVLALLMGIPGTALAVGFNALFAEAVPPDWRAYVAGIRNVVLSVVYIATSLVCGWLLNHIRFPSGYQIVFTMGFIGAVMSSYHLYHVHQLTTADMPRLGTSTGDLARPGFLRTLGDNLRPGVGLRFLARAKRSNLLRTDILRTPFRKTLLVFLLFHLAQYLAIPIFPLYTVNQLHLNDQQIGVGTALFYVTVLIGSTQLNRLVSRMGHKNVTAFGVMGLSLYPILLSVSQQVWSFYGVSVLGGFVWALVGGAYANYLLEKVPSGDRPPYLAWYNIVLNAAILIGSLIGPVVAKGMGLSSALLLFGVFRLLAGISILKWG
jgi:MFS family permease